MKRFFLAPLFLVAVAGGLRAATTELASEMRFEQRLGATLPLSAAVIDLDGTHHPLRDYFQHRPVVLYFGYAACPQLCSIVADGTVAALRQIRPAVGHDVDVIAFSIDPAETAAAAQARLADSLHRYGDPRAVDGWHYLRGSEDSIRAIAEAAGFHFIYDRASRQYGHPSGFVVITPSGVVSRYFLGVDFDATEVARAIGRASREKTGEPALEFVLRCFRGDGITGRYDGAIWIALAIGTTATVLGLAAWIGWALREERRQARPEMSP